MPLMSINHLCFHCDITRIIWAGVSEIIKTPVGLNYENVARLWLSNEKNYAVNMFTSAIMWNM
jgi:hypothetical protein